MQNSYTDKILGTVILNESRRARSVSIRVGGDGQITLTYPTFYNKQKAIGFLEEKRDRILAIQERQQKKRESNPPASTYDQEALKAKAKEYLPRRIEEIAKQTKLSYNKVTVRTTRSKWGSCSGENNISLSIYLMILPPHLIDFVIIHELCHTVHHNHSPKFHALLNYICQGREKEFNRELRAYSIK